MKGGQLRVFRGPQSCILGRLLIDFEELLRRSDARIHNILPFLDESSLLLLSIASRFAQEVVLAEIRPR